MGRCLARGHSPGHRRQRGRSGAVRSVRRCSRAGRCSAGSAGRCRRFGRAAGRRRTRWLRGRRGQLRQLGGGSESFCNGALGTPPPPGGALDAFRTHDLLGGTRPLPVHRLLALLIPSSSPAVVRLPRSTCCLPPELCLFCCGYLERSLRLCPLGLPQAFISLEQPTPASSPSTPSSPPCWLPLAVDSTH